MEHTVQPKCLEFRAFRDAFILAACVRDYLSRHSLPVSRNLSSRSLSTALINKARLPAELPLTRFLYFLLYNTEESLEIPDDQTFLKCILLNLFLILFGKFQEVFLQMVY